MMQKLHSLHNESSGMLYTEHQHLIITSAGSSSRRMLLPVKLLLMSFTAVL